MMFNELMSDDFFGSLLDGLDELSEMVEPKTLEGSGKYMKSRIPYLMKTDIKDSEESYDFEIDLPGYESKDISAQIKDGNLIISAEKSEDKEEKKDSYVRRERYLGKMSRSYYVGEDIKEDEIKAKFENGVLRISVPKMAKEELEEKHLIAIEG